MTIQKGKWEPSNTLKVVLSIIGVVLLISMILLGFWQPIL